MAIDPNIFRLLSGAAQFANAANSASAPLADTSPAMMAAQGQPASTPAVTPEQQAILEGANAPAPAAQSAAIQEQRILESQNPQMAQQSTQQQQVQNAPGGVQPQQSTLGNFSQEQTQQGQQNAQTASEKSLWDTIAGGMSGEGLTGEALADWRKNRALGAALGMMGSAIGGNTTGGRLAEGTYQLGAGSLAAKNAELREQRQNDFMQAAANALGIKTNTAQNQPTQQTLPNGESSLQGDMQSLISDYDKMLSRLNNLGSRV